MKNETEKIITAHGVTKKFGDFVAVDENAKNSISMDHVIAILGQINNNLAFLIEGQYDKMRNVAELYKKLVLEGKE